MTEPTCIKCGSPVSERPLYRTTPKGKPPKWTCESCLDKPLKDRDLVVDVIDLANNKNLKH